MKNLIIIAVVGAFALMGYGRISGTGHDPNTEFPEMRFGPNVPEYDAANDPYLQYVNRINNSPEPVAHPTQPTQARNVGSEEIPSWFMLVIAAVGFGFFRSATKNK